MGLYHDLVPSSKDNIQWPGTHLNNIRAIAMFHMFTSRPQLRMPGPVHSFGYNMELYHGLVPSSQYFKVHMYRLLDVTK